MSNRDSSLSVTVSDEIFTKSRYKIYDWLEKEKQITVHPKESVLPPHASSVSSLRHYQQRKEVSLKTHIRSRLRLPEINWKNILFFFTICTHYMWNVCILNAETVINSPCDSIARNHTTYVLTMLKYLLIDCMVSVKSKFTDVRSVQVHEQV